MQISLNQNEEYDADFIAKLIQLLSEFGYDSISFDYIAKAGIVCIDAIKTK